MQTITDISNEAELYAFIRSSDTSNYLSTYPNDAALAVFYFANYDFIDVPSAESLLDYIAMLERVYSEIHVHEGYGGLEADSAREAIIDVLRFNLQENCSNEIDAFFAERVQAYIDAELIPSNYLEQFAS